MYYSQDIPGHIFLRMPLEFTDSSLTLSQLNTINKNLQQNLAKFKVADSIDQRKKELMNLLHEFNDVKDAAQIVLGALANLEGKTFKEMHLHYYLPLEE